MGDAAAGDEIVRVVSWNVNFAVGDRMRSQAEYVKKLQPDLLCLQEVNPTAAHQLVERAGLDWLVLGVDIRPPEPSDTRVRRRGSAIAVVEPPRSRPGYSMICRFRSGSYLLK